MRRTVANGFTLIEILVVIIIISIVAAAAVVSIRHNQNREIATLAHEITQKLYLAQEQALLMPAVIGVVFNEQKITFVTYQPNIDAKKAKWVKITEHALQAFTISDDIAVTLYLAKDNQQRAENKNEEDEVTAAIATVPQIIIGSNGEQTPYTIFLGPKSGKPKYLISGNSDGQVTEKELD